MSPDLNSGDGHFMGLVNRYAGVVYWLAWYIWEDNNDAEYVLQQTFLKAHTSFGEFQRNESSLMWLLRIALSETFARLHTRGTGKLLRLALDTESEAAVVPREVVDWVDNIEEHYRREELRKILREAMLRLTPYFRIVFLLHEAAKLKDQEIADLLSLPVPSIKCHLLWSRLQLREHLNKHFKPNLKEEAQTA
jgi:RNA polymerase sigma-70 factor (ECF subfamily)